MTDTPVFSLAYTSVRPATIPEVVKLWNERSVSKNHEWVISVDQDDDASFKAALAALESHDRSLVVVNTGSPDCNAGWNVACASTTGKVIICVADDFVPPRNWDELLLSLEPKGWEDGEYVVKVEDGYVHDIFVLSILTRKRYERFGYVFYPKYRSMFNDTEFGDVARRDGVVINADHLLFEHLHPDCGKRNRDDHDRLHASKERWNASQMLYNFRKARNFPLDDGPKAQQAAPEPVNAKTTYVAYMQVTKDDLCLLDVCRRLMTEGVQDFCFCEPDRYWSGEAIEPADTEALAKVIETVKADGATVHHRKFHVEQFQVALDTRIQVETRVRNESLRWIRSLGYQHILVVDGDELWIPGTLGLIQKYVEQGHKAIACQMIPVIGFPGYPVDFATDLAVVYIGETVTFSSCRSPYIPLSRIPRSLIYHFTGTRRTMEETIAKHRRGGHYDDPDYDFEGWIKDVLPNIAPGLKNAHMFKPKQIWPTVRAWKKQELEQMPEAVRAFLGTIAV